MKTAVSDAAIASVISSAPFAQGQVDDDAAINAILGPRNEQNAQQWDREKEKVTRGDRIRRALMSPKGALGLPPLLDARRLEFGITDGAFRLQAMYDRVLIHQIEVFPVDTGLIQRTDAAKKRDLRTAARGIVVSAGLKALDELRSNGADLGHIVRFVHVSPWRHLVDQKDGYTFELCILCSGDVNVSEDLAEILRSGVVEVVRHHDSSEHQIRDAEGNMWDPVMPFIPDDK